VPRRRCDEGTSESCDKPQSNSCHFNAKLACSATAGLADLYTDILLQRLVPSGSPTFHDYGKRPPAFVLDLGCGPGHWMLYAAGVWKSSIITGLNLVNLTLPEVATTENVHFRRGTCMVSLSKSGMC
jgi:hypothetical protein